MTIQDPLSDMLVRIKNALVRSKKLVTMPSSRLKASVASVLKQEGYIADYSIVEEDKKSSLQIVLKYYQESSVIEEIKRISKPSLRVYAKHNSIPSSYNGLGVVIVSTPLGIMTGVAAKNKKVGGEVLCSVF
jgi:small subunit ribosomal protein S8